MKCRFMFPFILLGLAHAYLLYGKQFQFTTTQKASVFHSHQSLQMVTIPFYPFNLNKTGIVIINENLKSNDKVSLKKAFNNTLQLKISQPVIFERDETKALQNKLITSTKNIPIISSSIITTIPVESKTKYDQMLQLSQPSTQTSDILDMPFGMAKIIDITPANPNSKVDTNQNLIIRMIRFIPDLIFNRKKTETLKYDNKLSVTSYTSFDDEYIPYTPKGVFGSIGRTIRRRVLNILDRSTANWANSLYMDTPDEITFRRKSVKKSNVIVKNPYSDKRSQTRRERFAKFVDKNIFSRFKPRQVDAIGIDIPLEEDMLKVFNKNNRYEFSYGYDLPNTSRDKNIITSTQKFFRNLFNRSGYDKNMESNLFGGISTSSFYQPKQSLKKLQQSNSFLNNNYVNPVQTRYYGEPEESIVLKEILKVRDVIGDVGNNVRSTISERVDIFGKAVDNVYKSSLKVKNSTATTVVNENKGERNVFNVVTQWFVGGVNNDMNVDDKKDGKQIVGGSFKNLVQAGKEAVVESSEKFKSAVSNSFNNVPTPQPVDINIFGIVKVKFTPPWELFYRGEIPFFENNKITAAEVPETVANTAFTSSMVGVSQNVALQSKSNLKTISGSTSLISNQNDKLLLDLDKSKYLTNNPFSQVDNGLAIKTTADTFSNFMYCFFPVSTTVITTIIGYLLLPFFSKTSFQSSYVSFQPNMKLMQKLDVRFGLISSINLIKIAQYFGKSNQQRQEKEEIASTIEYTPSIVSDVSYDMKKESKKYIDLFSRSPYDIMNTSTFTQTDSQSLKKLDTITNELHNKRYSTEDILLMHQRVSDVNQYAKSNMTYQTSLLSQLHQHDDGIDTSSLFLTPLIPKKSEIEMKHSDKYSDWFKSTFSNTWNLLANSTINSLTTTMLPTMNSKYNDMTKETSTIIPNGNMRSLDHLNNNDYNADSNNEQILTTFSEDSISSSLAKTVNKVPITGPISGGSVKVSTTMATSTVNLRVKPSFVEQTVSAPTRADFSFIKARQVDIAIKAAAAVKSRRDAKEYLNDIGLQPLLIASMGKTDRQFDRIGAIKGICKIIRENSEIAPEVAKESEFIDVLCDFMEAPLKGFRFRSQLEKEYEERGQRESMALMQRMIRSNDKAVELLQPNARLLKVLNLIIQNEAAEDRLLSKNSSLFAEQRALSSTSSTNLQTASSHKKQNTTVVDYSYLTVPQMARVTSWGLGGVKWKPRHPNQKGLRILSLDGGGTRGVISITLLKELMNSVSASSGRKVQPHEVFDIICGTSTGGIIAVLLGTQLRSVEYTEAIYDDFIEKVFSYKNNLKLVTEQAYYDENTLEKKIYEMCGNELLLDSNQQECPRVFCVSTKMNTNPPQTNIWRNYNYPPDQKSRYPGTYRVNTQTAVRATSAAPTFFVPVQWEGGIYADGALVANNPAAIALQEAKVLFPGVPLEVMVSLGTGVINTNQNTVSMGWDTLVNSLIASSTDTEDIHALLVDLLPKGRYFRFSPILKENLAIDEKNKTVLSSLKKIASAHYKEMETGKNAKEHEQLIRMLRGIK
eukprot:gene4221-5997_t